MESAGEGGGSASPPFPSPATCAAPSPAAIPPAIPPAAAAAAAAAPELGFTKVEAIAAEGLGRSDIYHIVKEVIGFVLYMHHQIPAILQHLEHEFDSLKEEYKILSSAPTELNPSSQRKHNLRKREVKQGIKRLEKLMNTISSSLSALQQALEETPDIQGVTLVLGGSLVRPHQVYEMLFSHEKVNSGTLKDHTKAKVAETLSRKAIRALISNGAGSCTYTGPTKLFVLVKCPCTFHLPLHFLPKRDFRYSKKIVPFKLHIKCKTSAQFIKDSHCTSDIAASTCLLDSAMNDVIWFQCRSVIKGLACKPPQDE